MQSDRLLEEDTEINGQQSPRKLGLAMSLLALLYTLYSALLNPALNYPAVLLTRFPLANPFEIQRTLLAAPGFVGLLICSLLFIISSRWLSRYMTAKKRQTIVIIGNIVGACWAITAIVELILLLLWSMTIQFPTYTLTTGLFVLTELCVPLLVAYWTVTLARQLQLHRVLAVLGAIGLLIGSVCSVVWLLNEALPPEAGFSVLAGILSILALVGSSLWLLWLGIAGLRLLILGRIAQETASYRKTQAPDRMARRGLLRLAAGVGGAIAGTTFVLARTGLMVTSSSTPESDEVPAVPSMAATYFYLFALLFRRLNPREPKPVRVPVQTENLSFPFPVSFNLMDANGVPAQLIQAQGATKQAVLLYLAGGGFISSPNATHYFVTAFLSHRLGIPVLMPQYRLAPENPFPAGLQDCVTAYHWLRSQGYAAEQIVIAGESAGGNLTMATALALREEGEKLPAALAMMSASFDLTKFGPDPMVGDLLPLSRSLYTDHGAIDPHNPLLSPLFADVAGLPPTLLLAGTEEWACGDNMRMAEHLRKARVETRLEIWPGMWHSFPLFLTSGSALTETGPFPEARLAIDHIVKFIRLHLKI